MLDDRAAPIHAAAGAPLWHAELHLRLERRGPRTVLAHAHHRGPLRVQKALHPEGPERVDLMILHPPSGICGGDRLEIDITLEPHAQARITTPGAAKWYRAEGRPAYQHTRLRVADGAALEWLPQEAIVFDGAWPCTTTDIDCSAGARACGWDIWMLGRLAAGERYTTGSVRQNLRLRRDGALLWSERVHLSADDPLRASPLGWNGADVAGGLWALGLPHDESLLDACRDVRVPGTHIAVTRLEHGLWIARALGVSAERVRTALGRIWGLLRPSLCGAPATPPRIWAT